MKITSKLLFSSLIITMSFSVHSDEHETEALSANGIVDRFYVGADNSCDFNTIQAALNAASNAQNPPEILIANNKVYNENIVIDQNNIFIEGSYADCGLARLFIHDHVNAKINGAVSSNSPSIHITGIFVHLKDIQVLNNESGGLLIDSQSFITLEDMTFRQLGSLTGSGAVIVTDIAQADLTIINSNFSFNEAANGAAINCKGSDNNIILSDETSFSENTSSIRGGAIFVESSCGLDIIDSYFTNNSSNNGGAIYSSQSIEAMIIRNTSFIGNTASSNGGAINAFSGDIDAASVRFIENESDNSGGAIYQLNARLIINANDQLCNSDPCNYFYNNKAVNGGAIFSNNYIDITRVFFEHNRADFGTAIHHENQSNAFIDGSVFHHNGNHGAGGFQDRNVIYSAENSRLNIVYSTFAENNILFSTFYAETASLTRLKSSIIYDPESLGSDVLQLDFTSTVEANCLIVHEDLSFNGIGTHVSVADPFFVDPNNGNFHINASISPAVDYCNNDNIITLHPDIDNELRGYDDPTVTNNPATNGAFDIGADESYTNDLIFADGYE